MERPINMFNNNMYINHLIAYCYTPLDKERMRAEYKNQIRTKLQAKNAECFELHQDFYSTSKFQEKEKEKREVRESISDNRFKNSFFSSLKQLKRLAFLIRRQHLVGNKYIIIVCIHFLILLHLTIKFLIITIFDLNDLHTINYMDNIYYPNLLSAYENPQVVSRIALILSLLFLSSRIRSILQLIQCSLINKNNYKVKTVTQLNVAAVTLFCHLSLADWRKFWKNSMQHEERVKKDRKLKMNHFRLNNTIAQNLDELPQHDLIYYVNTIDFNECYKGLDIESLAKIANTSRVKYQTSAHKNWFISPPVFRFPPKIIRLLLVANILSQWGILSGCAGAFIGYTYLDIFSSKNKSQDHIPLSAILFNYFANPIHVLRLLEVFVFFFEQIPLLLEIGLVYFDAAVIGSRIDHIIERLQLDLDLCDPKRCNLERVGKDVETYRTTQNFYNSNSKQYFSVSKSVLNSINYIEVASKTKELNKRTRYNIKLSQLMHVEFRHARDHHSSYLNIILTGNCFCLVYALSVLISTNTLVEQVIMTITIMACIGPCIFLLVFCTPIEKTVGLQLDIKYFSLSCLHLN